MSCVGSMPGVFTQETLSSLQIGDSMDYPSGCVSGNGNLENNCYNAGFGFPNQYNSPEYEFSSSGTQCLTSSGCNGCQCGNTSGPGRSCSCNGVASVYGTKCGAKRKYYNGDIASCLLRQASSSRSNTTGNCIDCPNRFWYTIGDNTYTCNPNISIPGNAGLVANVCSDLTKPLTRASWLQGNPTPTNPLGYCYNFVNAQVIDPNSASTVLQAAVNNMVTTIPDFGISDPNKAQTVSTLLNLCSTGRAAGSCDGALNNMCSNLSREDILSAYKNAITNKNDVASANIYRACGCHLPQSAYAAWANLGIDETNVACDPICMLPNVVKQDVNGQPAVCNQSLCLIDNVAIDIVNSQTGPINFNMVCGCNGSGGTCRCIFSDVSIFQENSTVGQLNFSQNCGSCQIPDPLNPGNFIPVNCNTGIPSGGNIPTTPGLIERILEWFRNHSYFLIFAIFALFVLIVIYWKNTKTRIIPKSPESLITLADLFDFE